MPFVRIQLQLQSQQIFCSEEGSLLFNKTGKFLIADDSKFLQRFMMYALKFIINGICDKILENE